jgi:hypothetical protein
MEYFTVIPEGQAIMVNRGVYRQVQVYVRSGKVYARHGSGYVRLIQGGSTSAPNIRWVEIDTPNGEYDERSGYVFYTEVTK